MFGAPDSFDATVSPLVITAKHLQNKPVTTPLLRLHVHLTIIRLVSNTDRVALGLRQKRGSPAFLPQWVASLKRTSNSELNCVGDGVWTTTGCRKNISGSPCGREAAVLLSCFERKRRAMGCVTAADRGQLTSFTGRKLPLLGPPFWILPRNCTKQNQSTMNIFL